MRTTTRRSIWPVVVMLVGLTMLLSAASAFADEEDGVKTRLQARLRDAADEPRQLRVQTRTWARIRHDEPVGPAGPSLVTDDSDPVRIRERDRDQSRDQVRSQVRDRVRDGECVNGWQNLWQWLFGQQ